MVLALCKCCLRLLFNVCGNISELFLGDSNEEKSITPLRTLCPLKLCPQFLHTPSFRPWIQIQLPLSVGWTFSALETGHEKRVLCLVTCSVEGQLTCCKSLEVINWVSRQHRGVPVWDLILQPEACLQVLAALAEPEASHVTWGSWIFDSHGCFVTFCFKP